MDIQVRLHVVNFHTYTIEVSTKAIIMPQIRNY